MTAPNPEQPAQDAGTELKRKVELTREAIDSAALVEFCTTPEAGAVVLFLGTVRELTHGRRTLALDYEAYPGMALKEMERLADEAEERWPLVRLAVVHRLGHLLPAEASVAIAVSSPHRKAAFEAGQFLIDELKVRVPVWKQENWDDGTTEWVHPGTESTPAASQGPRPGSQD